jgi:hypothetical protein
MRERVAKNRFGHRAKALGLSVAAFVYMEIKSHAEFARGGEHGVQLFRQFRDGLEETAEGRSTVLRGDFYDACGVALKKVGKRKQANRLEHDALLPFSAESLHRRVSVFPDASVGVEVRANRDGAMSPSALEGKIRASVDIFFSPARAVIAEHNKGFTKLSA